jgi:methionyl-tRNA formyltransferase
MKILFLGYDRTKTSLIDFLINRGHVVTCASKKILDFSTFDMVISFGYSHIIKEPEILTLKRPIINLHISFLPYNKGAHPNFWSHYENTPSGVSIHEIDMGVDTGPILFQKEMNFKSHEKLRSSYSKLRIAIESLFIENITSIESMSYKKSYPKSIGTFHKMSDLPSWVNWDMSIKDVHGKN